MKTKFILKISDEANVAPPAPSLKEGLDNSEDSNTGLTVIRLEEACNMTLDSLKLQIVTEESNIKDIQSKLDYGEKSPEQVKEMFWGKDWRFHVQKLNNKKIKHNKNISYYKQIIDMIKENVSTDDLNVASNLIDIYFKFVKRIGEAEIKKNINEETVLYDFTESIPENQNYNRHAVLERYTKS